VCGRAGFGRAVFGRAVFGRAVFGRAVFGRAMFGRVGPCSVVSGRVWFTYTKTPQTLHY